MQKSKMDFIADLLKDKRIDSLLKERTFDLAAKEVQNVFDIENVNSAKISELEKAIRANEMASPESDFISKPKYHNPKKTTEFLRLFDSDLKFLTHKWESSNINFEDFRISLIKKAQNKINDKDFIEWTEDESGKKKQNYRVPAALWYRVSAFINKNTSKEKKENDPEWFAHNIFGETVNSFYSWNNDKFIKWFESSISKDITSPEINEKMILPFKNSIQIRSGDFQKHIAPLVLDKLGTEYKVNYINLEAAKFYTDVQSLMIGIISILEQSIKPWAEKNDFYSVNFEFVEVDDMKVLKIIHLASNCNLSTTNSDLLGGDMKAILKKFNKVCNWSIEASFADGNKRLNLLTDMKDLNYTENLDYKPQGFTHTLTFY